MPSPTNSSAARRPGRPRDPDADRAIVAATLAVLAERGFAGLTIAQVASLAGVSRPTIYRRWAGREDLVVDALAATVPVQDPVDTGDLVDDIETVVRQAVDGLGGSSVGPLVIGVLAASAQNPVLAEALAERYLAPRLDVVTELIERGQHSGALRADLSPELVRDLFLGPLVYRWLVTGAPMAPTDSDDLRRVLSQLIHHR